jgi:MFS family permease
MFSFLLAQSLIFMLIPTLLAGDFRFVMILIGFGMVFVGSQVQPLIFAAMILIVSAHLNASDLLIWFFSTQLVATGVIAPFAGPLANLLGRKMIAIAGILSCMIGMILSAATPNATGYIAGQDFAGMGMVVQELMATAACVETVPTKYQTDQTESIDPAGAVLPANCWRWRLRRLRQ